MKKRKLLKVIPILLFSPLVITSLASCGEVISVEETKVTIESNQGVVANGSYQFKIYDEKNHSKNLDETFVGDTLKIENILPNDGYELDKIIIAKGETVTDITSAQLYKFETSGKYVLTVSFKEKAVEPVTKKSKILIEENITHGSVAFKDYTSGDEVINNTTIVVVVAPDEGYELDTLKVNDTDIFSTKTFTTSDEVTTYTVTATFKEVVVPVVKKSTLTIDPTITNGTVTFKDFNNNDAVINGTKVTVYVTPKYGYELDTLTVNDKDIKASKSFTTSEDVEVYLVKATFKEKIKYSKIICDETYKGGTVEFVDHKSGDEVVKGTKITVKVTLNPEYELDTLKVNDLDIKDTKEFITDDAVAKYEVFATFKRVNVAPTTPEDGSDLVQFKYFDVADKIKDYTDTYFDTGSIIKSISSHNVYSSIDERFVRIGSKDIEGDLTFNLVKTFKIDKVILHTKTYDLNTKIGFQIGEHIDNAKEVVDGDVIYDNLSIEANSFTISSLAIKKRVCLYGVSLYIDKSVPSPDDNKATILYQEPEFGTIKFKDLANDSKVALGTHVEVLVTPKDGYELTKLMVNDLDITKDLAFDAAEVKEYNVVATFTKIPAKSTLKIDPTIEHGTVTFDGYKDGDVVLAGTTVKVIVKPDAGYKLSELRAGTDVITDTLEFVVKENKPTTYIKAEFILEGETPIAPEDGSSLIQFKNFGNSTGEINKFTINDYFDLNNIVKDMTGSAVFPEGTDTNNLKLASNKRAGNLHIEFKENLAITRIVLHTSLYNFKAATAEISLGTGETIFNNKEQSVVNGTLVYDINNVATNYLDISAAKGNSYCVNAIQIYTGELPTPPVVEKSTVTIANYEHGSVKVNDNIEVSQQVAVGTEVKVSAIPEVNYELESLKVNGIDIVDNKFIVTEANITYEVVAVFVKESTNPEPTPDPDAKADPYSITFNAPTGENGNLIESLDYVDSSKIIKDSKYSGIFVDKMIRFSSKKSTGELTIIFNKQIVINNISLNVEQYGEDDTLISVILGDDINTTKQNKAITNEHLMFTFDSYTTDRITIKANANKQRFYLYGIDINYSATVAA